MGKAYIEVDDQEYKIESSSNEWKLYKYNGVGDDGSENLSGKRHYTSLSSLVDALYRLAVRTSDFDGIDELSNKIERIREELEEEIEQLWEIDGS